MSDWPTVQHPKRYTLFFGCSRAYNHRGCHYRFKFSFYLSTNCSIYINVTLSYELSRVLLRDLIIFLVIILFIYFFTMTSIPSTHVLVIHVNVFSPWTRFLRCFGKLWCHHSAARLPHLQLRLEQGTQSVASETHRSTFKKHRCRFDAWRDFDWVSWTRLV